METTAAALARAIDHHRAGRLPQAADIYFEILCLAADEPQARELRGLALYNLGNVFKDQAKWAEAATCYEKCLAIHPHSTEVHNNLGIVLAEQQKLMEAAACYERAITLKPDFAKAHYNLGNVFRAQGELEAAILSYRCALKFMPESPETLNNLGNALRELALLRSSPSQGLDEAKACFQRALDIAPDHAEIHLNLAMIALLTADFERGWREYEWRCETKQYRPRSFSQPMWKGEPLVGKTILLHAEQGFGDTIHFVRYAALVKEKGGRVILLCQPALVRLLERCSGLDQVLSSPAELPSFDFQIPLLSLPGLFQTSLQTIPAKVPYIFAPAGLRDHWASKLSGISDLKVGITWQGSPDHKKDRFRSIPLSCFEPLTKVKGVRLFSLQKGPGIEQMQSIGNRFEVSDLNPLDFIDSAAAIVNLDLVIGCDTAVIHLAGALGRPVWLALPFTPDWRWLLHRSDSPWYRTMCLFRQSVPGRWESVFENMAESLKAFHKTPMV